MSKREATLCDHPELLTERAVRECDRLAIGVCVACGRDTCANHTHREAGALLVKLTIMQGSNPQGPERVTHETAVAACLCLPCEREFLRLGLRGLTERLAATAHEMIRAEIAARALEKQASR